MNAKWTPEFEEMWKHRLEVVRDKAAPFRRFIQKVSELEIEDALQLAIWEIERLRDEQNPNAHNDLVDGSSAGHRTDGGGGVCEQPG
jgi:hypothetical protein